MNRRRATCILFAVLAFGGLVHAQQSPTYKPHDLAPSLRAQANTALGKGDHAAARSLLERWLEADPRDSRSWYSLARIYAMTGDKAKAIDAFERSVDAGLFDPDLPQGDKDLDSIRIDPRFDAAVARIKQRRTQRHPVGYMQRMAPMRSQGSYIVMLPPDYETSGREYPLCVILQGSGSSELLHGKMADRLGRDGVIYAAVRAPYPYIGAIASSGQGAYTAWPPEEFPANSPLEDSVHTDYVNWIFDVVGNVEREFRTQRGRVFIYGHSQGGRFATLSALLHPERIASYLSQAGSELPARMITENRMAQMKERGVSVWLVHGLSDQTVPVAASTKLADRLKAAGVLLNLRTPEGDHTINDEMTRIGKQWVDEVVKGK